MAGHPKIGIIRKRPEDFERVCAGIERLTRLLDAPAAAEIRSELHTIVPEYTPSAVSVPPPAAGRPAKASAPSDAPAELPTAATVKPA